MVTERFLFRSVGTCRCCKQTVSWSRARVASHKRANCQNASKAEKDYFYDLKKRDVVVLAPAPLTRSKSKEVAVTEQNSTQQKAGSSQATTAFGNRDQNRMERYSDSITSKDTEQCDNLFADFVYRCAIPFRVADSQALKDFITKLRPSYVAPTSYRLRTTLLDAKYLAMKKKTDEYIAGTVSYTLISDGWTNITGHHLVNFVVQVPGKSPFYFKSIDSSNVVMNGENIAEMIIGVATEVGISKWACLITDNAPSMRKAWKIIKARYPLVFANGCAAHVGNLIIRRVSNEPHCDTLLDNCTKTVKYINNHTRLHNKFEESQKLFGIKHTLKMPVATRFYTQYLCAKSVLVNKRPIIVLFEDNENLINSTGKEDTRKGVRDIIQSANFWKDLRILTDDILQPLVDLISELEADNSRLDHIYAKFSELKVYFQELDLSDTSFDTEMVLEELRYYWGFLHTESMGFAYVLNPKNLDKLDKMQENDYEDTIEGLEKYLNIYYEKTPEMAKDAVQDMKNFFVSYSESSADKKVRFIYIKK